MGVIKQAQIEQEDRERKRMREPDWPRCNRCSEPVDYEKVQLDEEGNINPFFIPSLCFRCEYMTR